MKKIIFLSLFSLVSSLAMSQEAQAKKGTSTAEIIANILSNTGGGY